MIWVSDTVSHSLRGKKKIKLFMQKCTENKLSSQWKLNLSAVINLYDKAGIEQNLKEIVCRGKLALETLQSHLTTLEYLEFSAC